MGRILLLVFLLGALGIEEGQAANENGKAQELLDMLKDRDQTIKKIVSSETGGEAPAERAQLKEVVGDLFDFGTFSRLALGRYWEERTEDEQKEFTELCRRLIERNYADPKLYTKSEKIDYIGAEIKEEEGTVKTVVHYKDEKSGIDYKLHTVDGQWRVYDMVIDDLSIVRNNRSQFYKEIRKSSYEGLVKKLRNKLSEEDVGGKGEE